MALRKEVRACLFADAISYCADLFAEQKWGNVFAGAHAVSTAKTAAAFRKEACAGVLMNKPMRDTLAQFREEMDEEIERLSERLRSHPRGGNDEQ